METAQPGHASPTRRTYVPAVPVSHIGFECSCDPADDPTPLCNFWTDVESCILATLCRPFAFGLNRERAGLGKCCPSCLCYTILIPVLVLIAEVIAVSSYASISSDCWSGPGCTLGESPYCIQRQRQRQTYSYSSGNYEWVTEDYNECTGGRVGQNCEYDSYSNCRNWRNFKRFSAIFFTQLTWALALSIVEGCNRTQLKLVTEGKAPNVDCRSAVPNILAYLGSYVAAVFLSVISFGFGIPIALWVVAMLPAQETRAAKSHWHANQPQLPMAPVAPAGQTPLTVVTVSPLSGALLDGAEVVEPEPEPEPEPELEQGEASG